MPYAILCVNARSQNDPFFPTKVRVSVPFLSGTGHSKQAFFLQDTAQDLQQSRLVLPAQRQPPDAERLS